MSQSSNEALVSFVKLLIDTLRKLEQQDPILCLKYLHPEKYGAADRARMEKGKPPIGPDGHPIELHHVDRTPNGGLDPMTRTDHRLGGNFKKNHPE